MKLPTVIKVYTPFPIPAFVTGFICSLCPMGPPILPGSFFHAMGWWFLPWIYTAFTIGGLVWYGCYRVIDHFIETQP